MRVEKLHLDRALVASTAPELTHVLSSLPKMSPGFSNPCGYINQPARTVTHAGSSELTALGPERGPEQSVSTITVVSQYGKPGPGSRRGPNSQSQGAAAAPLQQRLVQVEKRSRRERSCRYRPRSAAAAERRCQMATEQPGHERVEFRAT